MKRDELNVKCEAERKKQHDMLHEVRFTNDASRLTLHASRHSPGFTLLEVIGVLAVMATLMAIVAPKVVEQIDRAAQDAEAQNLVAIGEGVELYLRQNFSWPASLSVLSPDFVPYGNTQITTNARGYTRYFFAHPDTSSYDNATGLTISTLSDARFLLISNVASDAAPTIINAIQFNAWWNTDETTTPDLQIYRGHVGENFSLVSLSVVGAGGSYRINGTKTNSAGGTLTSHGNYHLIGTPIELDEANNFAPGQNEIGFTLAADAGYQFNPTCTAGSQWYVLGSSCS